MELLSIVLMAQSTSIWKPNFSDLFQKSYSISWTSPTAKVFNPNFNRILVNAEISSQCIEDIEPILRTTEFDVLANIKFIHQNWNGVTSNSYSHWGLSFIVCEAICKQFPPRLGKCIDKFAILIRYKTNRIIRQCKYYYILFLS